MAIDDDYGLWIENAGSVNNALDYRRLLGSQLNSTAGLAGTSTFLAVTEKSGTPNMSVDVAAGGCYVLGSESATQGMYYVHNAATQNVVIAAADATNPRYDMICVQIRDSAYSGASDDARITVTQGTPAASPAEPTAPANSYTLARVRVEALATSIVNAKITDRRGVAVGAGGYQDWTPSVHKPVGTNPSYSLQVGRYTRMGMRIAGYGCCVLSSGITSGSIVKVGLPVAMANVANAPNVGTCRFSTGAGATGAMFMQGVSDAAYGTLYQDGGTGAYVGNLSSGEQFYYEFDYEAAT